MKFKGYKVGDIYLTKQQLENMKIPGTDICIPIDSIPYEECYTETVENVVTELVCDRKAFPFPIYRIRIEQMSDGRIKKQENGEILDKHSIFQDKENRKSFILRIDDWQAPGMNQYIGPNIQVYTTPEKIVKEMCSQFEAEFNNFTTSEFFCFNMEYVEELVFERNVKRTRVKFFTDNIIKAKWTTIMYGVESYIINIEEFFNSEVKDMPKTNKIIVLGNPPYHTQTEKQKERDVEGAPQAKPIYNQFVATIIDVINPNLFSMIIPSRWMNGGMGLDSFRDKIMSDRKIKSINHFPGERQIFPNNQIAGGVNYFLRDTTYDGDCEFYDGNTQMTRNINEFNIIVQDNTAVTIIKKIQEISTKTISEKVLSRKPFGLASNFSNFSDTGVTCHAIVNKIKTERFVNPSDFNDKNAILDRYKVCMAGASGFYREGKYSVGNPFIIPPNEICTETYIVINSFETEQEAVKFIEYTNTKFFKFLLWQMLTTQNNSRKCYCFVPDQEDYSKSYNDDYLYQKYNLSSEQIEYIETKIKTIP